MTKYTQKDVRRDTSPSASKYQQALSMTGQTDDFNPYDYVNVDDYPNTARGRARYQEDLARLLYVAQIEQENRMNEYNSPSAQAARMRAAGLNPDILGVENHGATNVAGYQGNPLEGIPTNMDMISNIIGVVSSVGSIASAFMSGIPEFESKNIQNIGSSVSAAGSLWNLFDSVGSLTGEESTPNMIADLLPSLPKRYRKRIQKAYDRFQESYGGKTSFNKGFAGFLNSQGEFNRAFVNPFNQQIDANTWSKIWKPYYDGVVQCAQRFLAEGRAATSQAEMDQLSVEIFRDLKQPLQEVIKNIDKYFNDNTAGSFLKAATAAAILQYLPL